jgi:serine phosphatase RsbU (regulator of sigma subunit)
LSYEAPDTLTGTTTGFTGVAIPGENGKYSLADLPFRKNKFCFTSIFFDSDSAVWLGSQEVYHFNGNMDFSVPPFSARIRKAAIAEDSIVFHGYSYNESGIAATKKKLPYKFNTVTFDYAALTYYNEKETRYQIWLEGFDKGWSKWTDESKKTYNNLRERSYKFHVRAKNIYNILSEEDIYEFRIMPPWHRSYPAYILYLLLFALAMYLAVRINTKRLKEANVKLEKIVKDRTIEIEKQRDVVISQKNHIERINAEITDSIKYARYIQTSILPREDHLKSSLGEHFVLFRPKDIVSGDFYWVSKVEKIVVAAVADCTGHGVPGAFMSMLGAAFLNEIINKEYITHPAVVLRRLRKEVIHSMQQRGDSGEQQDGMDIALCAIDHENMKLQFAGANNPLYLVRKSDKKPAGEIRSESGDYRLYEIKGDHMPIGIYYKMDNFTLHEIDILKGDMFYMFSDGFADQFGGPEGKKLGYRTFRECLLKSSLESLKEQKESLEKMYESWIGNNSQIDDIIVIGFKI